MSLRIVGVLESIPDLSIGHAPMNLARRNAPGHDRSGGYDRSIADLDPGQYDRAGSDPYVAPNHRGPQLGASGEDGRDAWSIVAMVIAEAGHSRTQHAIGT